MTGSSMHGISERPSRTARSPEELFPLLEYCRAGKLREVREWTDAGHPVNPPPNAKRSQRRSPLEVAIERGFFALAELLLDGGATADGAILECAVRHRRADIAELLIKRGAPPDAVWHGLIYDAGPEMIRLFIAHGFDPTSDFAYHRALCEHVHPHLVLLKDYKERFPDLQRQAETALAHYCHEGNLRAVSLLCWAGARPDASVPYRIEDDDPETRTTPLEEAAGAGHLPVLKRLKPQNFPEVLKRLMDALWLRPSGQMIDYLLELGAPLNTKPDGGSRLLESLIRRLDERGPFPASSSGRAEPTLSLIAHITECGAKWIPDPEDGVRHHRQQLRSIKPEHMVQFFRVLKSSGAASVEFMDAILASPALKTYLGTHLKTIEHILHPPEPKPAPRPRSEIASTPPVPRPTASKLVSRAREWLLDVIRRTLIAHFTERKTRLLIYAHGARRHLGMPSGNKENLTPIFAAAMEWLNERTRAYTIAFDDESWIHGSKQFSVVLKADAEWPEVVQEFWRNVVSPNQYLLTDAGLRLFDLIQSGAFASGFRDEKTIATAARLGRDIHHLESYLWEIRSKTPVGLRWERTGGERYADPRLYRIWVDVKQDDSQNCQGLNPRFEIKFDQVNKTDLDAARQRIHGMVLKASPEGDKPLFVFAITTYRQLIECFSDSDRITGSGLANFFGSLKFNDALICRYHFGDHANRWYLSPWQNGHIESFHGSLRDECLDRELMLSVAEARVVIKDYRRYYNEVRPHGGIGYRTPAQAFIEAQTPDTTVTNPQCPELDPPSETATHTT